MHCNNTGNSRPRKPHFSSLFFLCSFFFLLIWAPGGNVLAAAESGTAYGSGIISSRNPEPVLYSLQINSYIYESAARRAYEALEADLQADGFVYKTNSGYYTLRFGQAGSRNDLKSLETKLKSEGYSYTMVRTDPAKLNIAPEEIQQMSESAAAVQVRPETLAEGEGVFTAEARSVLYSLQINTYRYESAAQRAYEVLEADLQADAFVYRTDSGYYTLRFGQAGSRIDLKHLETKLESEGYSYTMVRTDPAKLKIAPEEMQQISESAAAVQARPQALAEAEDVYTAEARPVLYSLQINTYRYESAAQRAYEALEADLQADAFVYRTDSGYYTLRFGQAGSRNDLKHLETKLENVGYSYTMVRTDPVKLNIGLAEIQQKNDLNLLKNRLKSEGYAYTDGRTDPKEMKTLSDQVQPEEEPAVAVQARPDTFTEAEDVYAAESEAERALSASNQGDAAAEMTGKKKDEEIANSFLYQDDLSEVHDLPAGGVSVKLSLKDVIRMAIDQNSDIKIASFLSPIAEEEKKATRTVYDPSVVAENNIYKTDRPVQSKLDLGAVATENFEEDRWDLRAGIRQPLPTGGTLSLGLIDVDHLDSSSDLVIPNPQYTSRITLELRQALLKEFGDKTNHTAMEMADLNMNISSMEFRRTMANVVREVGTYYWRLVYYTKQIGISRKYLQDAEDIYQKLVYRQKSGLADLLDVDRALAAVQDRKAILIKANTEYKLAMDHLKLLLGFAPEQGNDKFYIIPTESFATIQENLDKASLLEEAFMNRPEYAIAKDRVSSAEVRKGLAKHLKLPTLDAKAKYAFNALGDDFDDTVGDTYFSDNGSWAVGLELVWPIGGRKAEADYLKIVYEEKQSQAALAKISEEINFQINSSVTEIEQLLQEIEATGNSKEANGRLLFREKSRFEIRQVNIHSLLDAQDDYYFAYRAHIRSLSNYNISQLKLKWARGKILEDYGIAQQ